MRAAIGERQVIYHALVTAAESWCAPHQIRVVRLRFQHGEGIVQCRDELLGEGCKLVGSVQVQVEARIRLGNFQTIDSDGNLREVERRIDIHRVDHVYARCRVPRARCTDQFGGKRR